MTTQRNSFQQFSSIMKICGLVIVATALLATIVMAQQKTDKEIKEPGIPPARTPDTGRAKLSEVRIWNITNRPFTYRLERIVGAKWTEPITLQPGKYQAIPVPKPGSPSELEGIAANISGPYEGRFLTIRFAKYGGFMEEKLPLENGDQGMPYWFHVLDSNGFSDMITCADAEQARKDQAGMLRQKPLTPQEIEQIKFTLRANWEFYDN